MTLPWNIKKNCDPNIYLEAKKDLAFNLSLSNWPFFLAIKLRKLQGLKVHIIIHSPTMSIHIQASQAWTELATAQLQLLFIPAKNLDPKEQFSKSPNFLHKIKQIHLHIICDLTFAVTRQWLVNICYNLHELNLSDIV